MYSLKESWISKYGEAPIENWSGRMYCHEIDPDLTFNPEKTQGFMTAYAFILVTQGWLKVLYMGRELMLRPDDLHIYSPGFSLKALEYSDDFQGLSMVVDEHTAIEVSAVHDLVQIVYSFVVQLHEPKLSLSHEHAELLETRMREMIYYLHSDHSYRFEILRMLYSIFLLDLQDMQKRFLVHRDIPQRVEEIYIGFIRLIPRHFIEHHDIAFYASELNISSVYLSKVVRQVSGHTVLYHINKMRMIEASFLLRTTSMNIAEIADHLRFSDAASFSKFFLRHVGCTPKEYREKR